jgi:preprotein translocase subunit SecD
MNKYPPWKYALILVALVVSLLYAAPNLFGEVPAVQVSGIRASTKVDAAMQAGLEAALKEAGIAPTVVELDEAALRFRFADPDTQLKARDVIQSKVGPGYVVALNLVSNTPKWLQAIGSKPMYLGLDLRGGVHFLLQVDMKAAAAKSQERFLGDLRVLMRDKKIYYSGLARDGDRLVVKFRDRETRAAALKEIGSQMPVLLLKEQEVGEDFQLIATIKPEEIKREQDLALQQNIQTLRNRVN